MMHMAVVSLSAFLNNLTYIKLNAAHCPLHTFCCDHWSEETLNFTSLHKMQSVVENVVLAY